MRAFVTAILCLAIGVAASGCACGTGGGTKPAAKRPPRTKKEKYAELEKRQKERAKERAKEKEEAKAREKDPAGAGTAADASKGLVPVLSFRPENTDGGDRFGAAIAVPGNVVVIGAPGRGRAGAAHFFDANSGALLGAISNPDASAFDRFGASLAALGDGEVVIGAPQDDPASTPDAGSIYVVSAANRSVTTAIPNPVLAPGAQFGSAIAALSADVIAVGAPFADAGTGAVYLVNARTGALLKSLSNPQPDAGDLFGAALAASGTRLYIGAPGDSLAGTESGTVYVTDVNTNDPMLAAANPQPGEGDRFGATLAVAGDALLVGAPEDSPEFVEHAGSVFVLDATTAQLRAAVREPSPQAGRRFGASLAAYGRHFLAGAPGRGGGDLHLLPLAGGTPVATFPHPKRSDGELGAAAATHGWRIIAGAPESGAGGAAWLFQPPASLPPAGP